VQASASACSLAPSTRCTFGIHVHRRHKCELADGQVESYTAACCSPCCRSHWVCAAIDGRHAHNAEMGLRGLLTLPQ
jgi:hypothetical protein